jgi:3-deoxy-D-manno-octulosonic-acid transferase
VVHGPHVFNFADVYAALNAAGGAIPVDSEGKLTAQIGRWLSDQPSRQRAVDAGAAVVEELGGALDRSLAALEPYLMQLRIERGAHDA